MGFDSYDDQTGMDGLYGAFSTFDPAGPGQLPMWAQTGNGDAAGDGSGSLPTATKKKKPSAAEIERMAIEAMASHFLNGALGKSPLGFLLKPLISSLPSAVKGAMSGPKVPLVNTATDGATAPPVSGGQGPGMPFPGFSGGFGGASTGGNGGFSPGFGGSSIPYTGNQSSQSGGDQTSPPLPGQGTPSLSPDAAAKQKVEAARQHLRDLMKGIDDDKAPKERGPIYGTKDLIWAIPTLIAALSGGNGPALAGALLSGATQGKAKAADRDYQNQYRDWQQEHQKKIDAASQADREVGWADRDNEDTINAGIRKHDQDERDRQNHIMALLNKYNSTRDAAKKKDYAAQLEGLGYGMPSAADIEDEDARNKSDARDLLRQVFGNRIAAATKNGEVSDTDAADILKDWNDKISTLHLGGTEMPFIPTGQNLRNQLKDKVRGQFNKDYSKLDEKNRNDLIAANAEVEYYKNRMDNATTKDEHDAALDAYNAAVHAFNARADEAATNLRINSLGALGFGMPTDKDEMLAQMRKLLARKKKRA